MSMVKYVTKLQVYLNFLQMKQWFEDAWWSWGCCIHSRFVDYNDNIDRCAFFEELNYGWCQMYIYDYDDWYNPTISPERKLRLGQ